MFQPAQDLILIIKTDKRYLAASIFLGSAVVVWLFTGVWREPKVREEIIKNEREDQYMKLFVSHMNLVQSEFKAAQSNKITLKEDLDRTSNQLKEDRKELEWHSNQMIEKLEQMSSRLDKIVDDIGFKRVERTQANLRRKDMYGAAEKKRP